jgi:hypothetical protein
VLDSPRYFNTMKWWRRLQDDGWDQTVPQDLKASMNQVEWMQWYAIQWNKERCGPPEPIIRLPALGV